ncbi:uncharacterized protein LOC115875778 [Sitophilus oryzae]|uniref:Uncharacterized protein LOC115875778 n=1 Tax=Sitophilus oryzae TaxID=7048 RepID=A0A6J2X7H6_SITOR|nr:uncharacterized protein LOC115875778 [Sitophilus oryzae]
MNFFAYNTMLLSIIVHLVICINDNPQIRKSKIPPEFLPLKTVPANHETDNIKSYLPNLFIDKISHTGWIKPIQDKIDRISQFLSSQNYGNFQNLDPQNIIDRLHEKSFQLLSGPKASIYGLRPKSNYDYPFAYRRSLKT